MYHNDGVARARALVKSVIAARSPIDRQIALHRMQQVCGFTGEHMHLINFLIRAIESGDANQKSVALANVKSWRAHEQARRGIRT